MKWMFLIAQKARASLALGFLFVLMLITTFQENNHFRALQTSFSSVYEDRLLAESYIYAISEQLHEKQSLMNAGKTPQRQGRHRLLNDSIQALIRLYEATRLTPHEAELFEKLKGELAELKIAEEEYLASRASALPAKLDSQHQAMAATLNGLSDIQLQESRNLVQDSEKIVAASQMNVQLELVVLVVVGLFLQALVFTAKSSRPPMPRPSALN